jgi:ribosomal protein S18 acetylase RimI-like enzyme
MIRPATNEDIPKCKRLMHLVVGEVNSRHYSPEIIQAWQEHALEHPMNPEDVLVCAKEEIIGFGVIEGSHIRRVYVHPETLRKGIGRSIVESLEKIACSRGFTFCTLNSSSNAFEFYKKLGYEYQGEKSLESNGIKVTFSRMIKYLQRED